MHRQASVHPHLLPRRPRISTSSTLPAFEEEDLGSPVLGAGTVWAITEDSEAARAMIEFLKTPIAHEIWMAQSGFLTPHSGVDTSLYGDDTLRGHGRDPAGGDVVSASTPPT